MGQTVTLHTIYGVSKAKTDKAMLLEIEDNGAPVQSWIPLSVASVKFIGKDFQVKVVVPGWFFRKISWKAPVPYTPKAKVAAPTPAPAPAPVVRKNPYIGCDVGNMLEEQMILGEQLSAYQEGAMGDGPEQDRVMQDLSQRIKMISEAVVFAQQTA